MRKLNPPIFLDEILDKMDAERCPSDSELQNAAERNENRNTSNSLRTFPRPVATELAMNTVCVDQYAGKRLRIDENGNVVTGIVDECTDSDALYSKYLAPLPSTWARPRQFLVRLIFFVPERKRLVRFPEDVVEKAESDQRFGETMGKLREVKRSTKHRQRLSALLSPSQASLGDTDEAKGKPDLKTYKVKAQDLPYPPDWDSWLLADSSGCPCNCFSSLCDCGNKSSSKPVRHRKHRSGQVKYSDKFKVTEQKFCLSLDVIEDFMSGNMKTVDFTLGVIGLLPMKDTVSALEQPSTTSVPADDGGFNHIAAGIWFFTFAITDLFPNEQQAPLQSEFDELMNEFSTLAVYINRIARRTVILAKLLFVFGEAAMNRLESITSRLHIKSTTVGDFKMKAPIKFGQGLNLQTSQAEMSKFFRVVARRRYTPPRSRSDNPWRPFAQLLKSTKLEYLNETLAKLQHRLSSLNAQMRFLTDDLFERDMGSSGKNPLYGRSKKPKNETFLSALQSLDVVMYRFSVFDETTPVYERALMETVESVAADTFDLLTKGEKIVAAIVEIRDITELSISYMTKVYGIDFSDVIPSGVFTSKGTLVSCRNFCRKVCCMFVSDPVEPSSGSNPQDFFRTRYPQFLHEHSMMHSNTGYEFALQETTTVKEVAKLRCRPDGSDLLLEVPPPPKMSLDLNPSNGDGGVWENLSKTDITQLKDEVLERIDSSSMDMRPAIAAEVRRREDFKREIDNLYAQAK